MGEYAQYTNDANMHTWDGFADESYKAFEPSEERNLNIVSLPAETAKAWLVEVKMQSGKTVQMWFPKSSCRIYKNLIFLPAWLLQLKNKEANKILHP